MLTGAKITIYQLTSKLLIGPKLYEGTIDNDLGKYQCSFEFEQHNPLLSELVLIEVSGYFWNEITQKKSSEEITLSLVADIQDIFEQKTSR